MKKFSAANVFLLLILSFFSFQKVFAAAGDVNIGSSVNVTLGSITLRINGGSTASSINVNGSTLEVVAGTTDSITVVSPDKYQLASSNSVITMQCDATTSFMVVGNGTTTITPTATAANCNAAAGSASGGGSSSGGSSAPATTTVALKPAPETPKTTTTGEALHKAPEEKVEVQKKQLFVEEAVLTKKAVIQETVLRNDEGSLVLSKGTKVKGNEEVKIEPPRVLTEEEIGGLKLKKKEEIVKATQLDLNVEKAKFSRPVQILIPLEKKIQVKLYSYDDGGVKRAALQVKVIRKKDEDGKFHFFAVTNVRQLVRGSSLVLIKTQSGKSKK